MSTTTGASGAPLTEEEVRQFVDEWYRQLDAHPPVEEILPLVADEGLEFVLPEVTERGHEGFRRWCQGIFNTYFDEVHTLKQPPTPTAGDWAEVRLVVNWQARTWTPPEPKSRWLGFDAAQRWRLRRSPETGRPQIVTYVVEDFTPMPGSAGLATG